MKITLMTAIGDIVVLVNTGASINVVSEQIASQFAALIKNDTRKFKCRTGSGHVLLQSYLPITICYKDIQLNAKFYILADKAENTITWIIGRQVIWAISKINPGLLQNMFNGDKNITGEYNHTRYYTAQIEESVGDIACDDNLLINNVTSVEVLRGC